MPSPARRDRYVNKPSVNPAFNLQKKKKKKMKDKKKKKKKDDKKKKKKDKKKKKKAGPFFNCFIASFWLNL